MIVAGLAVVRRSDESNSEIIKAASGSKWNAKSAESLPCKLKSWILTRACEGAADTVSC